MDSSFAMARKQVRTWKFNLIRKVQHRYRKKAFQDGNGRVGRLIMFKECLKHNIVPFIITEELKMFYCRGIKEWKNERSYLRDTCLTGQDAMRVSLDYFGIKYQ